MKNLNNPVVSLCLPTLNSRKYLEQRVESILAQSLPSYEVVVCDSYSEDGTWQFLRQFAGDPRFRLHQVPREGLYAGWNECLRRCSGDFVYFATADDTLSPDFLEKMVGFARQLPDVDLFCCGLQPVDENDNPLPPDAAPAFENVAERQAGEWKNQAHLKTQLLGFLVAVLAEPIYKSATALLARRAIFEKTGGYPTGYQTSGDAAWAARASLFSKTAYYPERLATWRVHDQQRSQNFPPRTLVELRTRVFADLQAELGERITDVTNPIPDFSRRIKTALAEQRLAVSDLHRYLLRQDPRRFLHAMLCETLHAPGLLFRQAARLFPGDSVPNSTLRRQLAFLTQDLDPSHLMERL